MDIKAEAEKLIKKITGDKDMLAKFKKDPMGTVKGLIPVNVSADDLKKVVDLVKTKVNLNEAGDKISGATGKIKGLFGK